MKRLLSIFSAVAVVGSCGSNIVSCKGDKYKEIYLITDLIKVNDKSFNESGYRAGNSFVQKIMNKKNLTIGYNEPYDGNAIKNAYSLALAAGAKAVILPGYQHGAFINTIQKDLEGTNNNAVFIDGNTGLDKNGKNNQNIIAMKYRIDISGFYTGLSSIIWYFQSHTSAKSVKLATFGGQANATAVTPYLLGFFAAIDFFNEKIKDSEFAQLFNLEGRSIKADRIKSQDCDGPSSETDQKFFTNSFSAGDGKNISDTMISQGANVIFPVAGPQTADVLGAIVEKDAKNVYIDGVDTDQIDSYPTYSKYFLSSSLKNIYGSTMVALAHTEYFKDKVSQTDLDRAYKIGGLTKDDIEVNEDSPELLNNKDWDKANVSWAGSNLWFSGDFSTGDGKKGNKITQELHDTLKEYLAKNYSLVEASKQYYNDTENMNSTKLLNKNYISKWLDIVNRKGE